MSLFENKNFCEQIRREKRNIWAEMLADKYPLYLYGIGNIAEILFDNCKKHGIEIYGCFVDDDYYVDKLSFRGKRVWKKSEIFHGNLCLSVIIAIGDYYKGYLLEKQNKLIGNIYYVFNSFFGEELTDPDREFCSNRASYEEIYNLLADDFSKKCMIAGFNSILTSEANWLFECYEGRQNYFHNSVLHHAEIESFLDIGAYNGDTLRELIDIYGRKIKKVWAMEGDERVFNDLQQTIRDLEIENIVDTFCVFCGRKNEKKKIIREHVNTQITRIKDEGDFDISVVSVDSILKMRNLPVDYIKINVNIDGIEDVLIGCNKIIECDRPIIAVMLCNPLRIIEVMHFFLRRELKYKYYLRFHAAMPERLAFYALPE